MMVSYKTLEALGVKVFRDDYKCKITRGDGEELFTGSPLVNTAQIQDFLGVGMVFAVLAENHNSSMLVWKLPLECIEHSRDETCLRAARFGYEFLSERCSHSDILSEIDDLAVKLGEPGVGSAINALMCVLFFRVKISIAVYYATQAISGTYDELFKSKLEEY